ncbi:MAG TPA: TetR/AcrR family transcriptional regulator [Chitinophagaceae bacterium]|nr:TetR/AcrR family transcriptional regulator [Chitinophagaceae bacterium]
MDARSRIVETASRLFYEQGYNSTGINQVIKEAGVAKASLYQYFPSKDDLLLEYLKQAMAKTNQGLQSAAEKHKAPREKALAIFDFLLQHIRRTDFNGCNFLNISAELPHGNSAIKALIKKQKNFIRSLFATILEPVGKEDLADELYLLFDGALATSKVHGDVWPVKTARKVAEKLL